MFPTWRGKYTRLLVTFVQTKKRREEKKIIIRKLKYPNLNERKAIHSQRRSNRPLIVSDRLDNLLDPRSSSFLSQRKSAGVSRDRSFLIIFPEFIPDKTTSETRE